MGANRRRRSELRMKLKYDPKQILLAKLFFDHASEHRAQKSDFGRIQAVVAYANAAELLLKVIADSKGATPSKKYFTIHDLIDNLEKKLPRSGLSQGSWISISWLTFATLQHITVQFPQRVLSKSVMSSHKRLCVTRCVFSSGRLSTTWT